MLKITINIRNDRIKLLILEKKTLNKIIKCQNLLQLFKITEISC